MIKNLNIIKKLASLSKSTDFYNNEYQFLTKKIETLIVDFDYINYYQNLLVTSDNNNETVSGYISGCSIEYGVIIYDSIADLLTKDRRLMPQVEIKTRQLIDGETIRVNEFFGFYSLNNK